MKKTNNLLVNHTNDLHIISLFYYGSFIIYITLVKIIESTQQVFGIKSYRRIFEKNGVDWWYVED